ncbi:hypothetical protein Cst_c07490 [Thermoclostridium stercorarium subsp. stercorarium DSM 8532]|uniref:Uncharacterized protein n=1 Tax=Thermoclostridium stercorarium (strain ATCC 35414 / DSM 8532 / NCIMB 11754) TaxID=1121335 RepID=L7VQC1_THES1|nr:hypothetical protein Cst_c07490 [Thermoclostridium stercorarium subsp. stercorarium DSM 8532]
MSFAQKTKAFNNCMLPKNVKYKKYHGNGQALTFVSAFIYTQSNIS